MTRLRSALLFAAAAGGAAALHVVVDTPGTLHHWRQILPLALILGALVGALVRPKGALWGAIAAMIGLWAFAAVFAVGHGAIAALQGDAFGAETAAAFRGAAAVALGTPGMAALGLGALAGLASR